MLRDELPEMPAEVIEGVLLETHKMLLTGPSKAGKTWCLINLAVSVATVGLVDRLQVRTAQGALRGP